MTSNMGVVAHCRRCERDGDRAVVTHRLDRSATGARRANDWRPTGDRLATEWRPTSDRSATDQRPTGDRPATDRPTDDRPTDRPTTGADDGAGNVDDGDDGSGECSPKQLRCVSYGLLFLFCRSRKHKVNPSRSKLRSPKSLQPKRFARCNPTHSTTCCEQAIRRRGSSPHRQHVHIQKLYNCFTCTGLAMAHRMARDAEMPPQSMMYCLQSMCT